MMQLGSQGEGVQSLQKLLRHEVPGLSVDGVYGPRTERAVRHVQRRHGLYPPDGIAGPITLGALEKRYPASSNAVVHMPHGSQFGQPSPMLTVHARPTIKPATAPVAPSPGPLTHAVAPAIERAKHAAMPIGEVRPASSMRTSPQGLKLIFDHEAQHGVSNHLYWPQGASGVTLGAGYDMKERSAAAITADMQRINVAPDIAARIGKASGLQNAEAATFARDNKHLVDLTHGQEIALLALIITHYEDKVRNSVRVDLHQYEFDSLVSYAYNPGGGWHRVTALVNEHKYHEAMTELSKHVLSRHKVVKSLVRRREAEVRLFMYGEYS